MQPTQSSSVISKDSDLEMLLHILENKLQDIIIRLYTDKSGRAIYIEVSPDKIKDLALKLLELGFEHVKSVTGVDYPSENSIEVLIHVGSYLRTLRKYIVIIKTRLDRNNPRISTLTDVWPSSEFHEREAWEMFGIYFEGHPDLRRLLLPEDFEGVWPLRKDFHIRTRKPGEVEPPWK
ncbi:MAG: NADH-quinone oxidoreductase subunit C [Sulfolobales archaeon]